MPRPRRGQIRTVRDVEVPASSARSLRLFSRYCLGIAALLHGAAADVHPSSPTQATEYHSPLLGRRDHEYTGLSAPPLYGYETLPRSRAPARSFLRRHASRTPRTDRHAAGRWRTAEEMGRVDDGASIEAADRHFLPR